MNVEALLYKPSPFEAIWSHIGIPKQVHCLNSHKLKTLGLITINKLYRPDPVSRNYDKWGLQFCHKGIQERP